MSEWLLLAMCIVLLAGLLSGFPVAFVLAGVSLIFACLGALLGSFDLSYIAVLPNRMYGIMTNDLLIAVPLFVFMGVMLEKAKIAEELLDNMALLFGRMRAGLGISVMLVGTLLAASTGIVGATVITMGLISLPVMLRRGYSPEVACGSICASGTLGQIIPPSIVLILLGDQISNAYQNAQLKIGNLSPEPVSIADLFVGALIPGIGLVLLYMLWLWVYSRINPQAIPESSVRDTQIRLVQIVKTLVPPLLLIVMVLGTILTGVATATESASVGAVGAMLLAALRRMLSFRTLHEVVQATAKYTSMVFTILIGAALFTLVFRGYGGDDLVHAVLTGLPGGLFTVMLLTMLVMFLLGFFLDFIEIIFVVVPIIAPVLMIMGADPIWLAVMIAINLQTSFLTPPFGFALFYLRGVAPDTVKTSALYRGIIPFVIIQLIMLGILSLFPPMATWLPHQLYGSEEENIMPFESEFLQESYEVDF